jgi:predicted HicB family RNase H-like nuclease
MTTLKHKGYVGSIEVDVESDVLYGKLLHIRDLINYEADSPAALKIEFEAAVDDYLANCKKDQLEPDKPFKGSFNVRVSPELHRELVVAAGRSETTLNDYVTTVLTYHQDKTIADRVSSISEYQWLQFTSFHQADFAHRVIQTAVEESSGSNDILTRNRKILAVKNFKGVADEGKSFISFPTHKAASGLQ